MYIIIVLAVNSPNDFFHGTKIRTCARARTHPMPGKKEGTKTATRETPRTSHGSPQAATVRHVRRFALVWSPVYSLFQSRFLRCAERSEALILVVFRRRRVRLRHPVRIVRTSYLSLPFPSSHVHF